VKIMLAAILTLLSSEIVCTQEKLEYPSTSGNAYLRECSVIEKDLKDLTQADMKYVFACLGYTEGVMDGAMAEAAVVLGPTDNSQNQLAPFCVPSEADNGQLVRITLKYIRKHPEEAHKPGFVQIIRALREAFPCGGQTGKRQ
jgi:Rap1a immunity proteins